ncbi:hypothetical protein AMS68_003978 [Peltaster fructicola]|uniref:Dihydroneopterin aldolase/epimerase domain-containing protein n=1 Tax=Peltaster fructicola TaxID=286661 RepID=A0A6H0XUW5_9PEZI|nr:hypothetical protein AMS68_003978 [Peltaster fructicola]
MSHDLRLNGEYATQNLDLIHVQNLQLPAGVAAPDIWNQAKVQPCNVSLKLTLRTTFDSAAAADTLDDSTIHYGHLCKNIRTACAIVMPARDTLDVIFATVHTMGFKSEFVLSAAEITLTLPKASAHGGVVEMSTNTTFDAAGGQLSVVDRTSYKQLQIMTLIGVNASERTGQQLVVLSCDLIAMNVPTTSKNSLLGLERAIVRFVQDTAYETLESLANAVLSNMVSDLFKDTTVHRVHLKFEKPSAVVYADAPAIEIRRQIAPYKP